MHHEIPSKEEVGVGTSTSPRDLCLPGYCQVQLPVTTGSPSPGLICSAQQKSEGPEEETVTRSSAPNAKFTPNRKNTSQLPYNPCFLPSSPTTSTPHILGGLQSSTPFTLFCLCSSLFFSLLSIPILSCVSAPKKYRFPPL